MTIKEKLQLAIANKDWGLVEELTRSLDAPKPKKKPVKKATPKKAPVKAKQSTTRQIVDHQEWHNKHLYAPVALPDRPNKFAPEDYKPQKYTVQNDKKKAGKFAGKTFDSEEAYLKAAGFYSQPVPRKEKVKKVPIVCSACQRTYKLYPSEIHIVDEGKFRCESCILSNRDSEGGFEED